MKTIAALLACLALAGCAAGSGSRDRYGGLLTPTANPTEVIATELAFARAAREQGQWTAFRKYAADGALIFGRDGVIEAQSWLKAQHDPAQAVAWEPHAVWMSCDGSLAVTRGGFREPGGAVGVFNTVWQRQRSGDYKWVFDFGYPTETAPATPDRIAGEVADCNRAAPAIEADRMPANRTSRDGTLAWSFAFAGEGTRAFTVWLADEDAMVRVIDLSIPPADE